MRVFYVFGERSVCMFWVFNIPDATDVRKNILFGPGAMMICQRWAAYIRASQPESKSLGMFGTDAVGALAGAKPARTSELHIRRYKGARSRKEKRAGWWFFYMRCSHMRDTTAKHFHMGELFTRRRKITNYSNFSICVRLLKESWILVDQLAGALLM